jgi:hypothetical protein
MARETVDVDKSSAFAISFNVIGRFSIDKAAVNRFKNKKNSYHSTTLHHN